MEGALVGTVSYMAPEQVLRRDVDQRSDLWAFVFITFGVRNAMMATDTHFPRLETGSLSPVLPNRVTCFAVQTGGPAASCPAAPATMRTNPGGSTKRDR